MALTYDVVISQNSPCGNLYVEDRTVYGVSPETREDFGVALFVNIDPGNDVYTNDDSLTDLSNPGSDEIQGTWTIPINVSKDWNYEVVMFWCPLWEQGTLYDDGQIVYYNEVFYKKVDGVSGTAIPEGNPSDWTVLTIADYDEFDNSTGTDSLAGYESVIACPEYKVIFNECPGVHAILNLSDNTVRATITDYSGEEVLEPTTIVDGRLDVTLPLDGIYILTIEAFDGVIWNEVFVAPIYEYCKMKTCVAYLVDSLMCNEWDPCCENCDKKAIEKMQRQRLQLNKVFFLYGTLLSLIHTEAVEYLGVNSIEDDRYATLERVENLFEKIQDILHRCELCYGAWQTSTTKSTSSPKYKPCNC